MLVPYVRACSGVTDRYPGKEFTTKLPYQPGATLRVGVTLNVLGDGGVADARDYRTNANHDNYKEHRRYRD